MHIDTVYANANAQMHIIMRIFLFTVVRVAFNRPPRIFNELHCTKNHWYQLVKVLRFLSYLSRHM